MITFIVEQEFCTCTPLLRRYLFCCTSNPCFKNKTQYFRLWWFDEKKTAERLLRDHWETTERQLRECWGNAERMPRECQEYTERPLRDHWETLRDSERPLRDHWETAMKIAWNRLNKNYEDWVKNSTLWQTDRQTDGQSDFLSSCRSQKENVNQYLQIFQIGV